MAKPVKKSSGTQAKKTGTDASGGKPSTTKKNAGRTPAKVTKKTTEKGTGKAVRGVTQPKPAGKPRKTTSAGKETGLSKRFLKTRPACKVTFRLPSEEGGAKAAVAGDFSGWKPVAMKALKKGGFSVTIELATGTSYAFRYLVDGVRWCNDWCADAYIANDFGGDNSVVTL